MGIDETNAAFDQLDASLNDLEKALAPLLERPLEETLASLPGPAERAKVLFWVAYTIHSCSWIYAKAQGADIESHGVLDELKRIQPYNGKINAASASTSKPAEEQSRSMKLDKEGANRFIRAAISNQPKAPSDNSSFYNSKATVEDPLEGPGKHTRLVSLAKSSERAEASGKGTPSESSSEEEDLKVFDGIAGDAPKTTASGKTGKKRKWAAEEASGTATETSQSAATPSKGTIDPLQGYDNPEGQTKAQRKRAEKKKRKQLLQQESSTANSSAAPSPAASESGEGGEVSEKKKKKKKKNKEGVAVQ